MSDYIERILAASAAWRDDAPSVSALTPDFSTRSYYRVEYSSDKARPDKVIAMVYDKLVSPAAEQQVPIASDESFTLVQQLFSEQGIAVPEIYLVRKDVGVLFLEDLGDTMLGSLLCSATEDKHVAVAYFKDALRLMREIKSIKAEASVKLFGRKFSAPIFIKEMLQFPEHVLRADVVTADVHAELLGSFTWIASALEDSEWSLSHRDFHAWNLPVDTKGNLRLIDFQDALLGPDAYDLISLLGDRGTDSLLGKNTFLELLDYYLELGAKPKSHLRLLDLAAIQRDLRVCGLFHKRRKALSAERVSPSSEEFVRVSFWIETTEHRLGRTLRRILDTHSGATELKPLAEVFAGIENCAAGMEEGSWY